MSLKSEDVLNWIKTNGVQAAAWDYGKNSNGYTVYTEGPVGMVLTPVGGDVRKDLFVPMRVWTFIKKRIHVTPKSEPSMFKVV